MIDKFDSIDNPLHVHIDRYKSFFKLFIDFKRYINHFLLNDLVDNNYDVKFWVDFDDFHICRPVPSSVEAYKVYMRNVIDFVQKNQKN